MWLPTTVPVYSSLSWADAFVVLSPLVWCCRSLGCGGVVVWLGVVFRLPPPIGPGTGVHKLPYILGGQWSGQLGGHYQYIVLFHLLVVTLLLTFKNFIFYQGYCCRRGNGHSRYHATNICSPVGRTTNSTKRRSLVGFVYYNVC